MKDVIFKTPSIIKPPPKPPTSALPLLDLDKAAPARVPLELLRERNAIRRRARKAGFQTVEQLYDAVAQQFRLPRLELDTIELSLDLSNLVPQELADEAPHRAGVRDAPTSCRSRPRIRRSCQLFDWLARQLKRAVRPW